MRSPIGTIFRHKEPPEKIVLHGHQGECRYCYAGGDENAPGIVKMPRKPDTLELQPNSCWCLGCGQHYYIELKENETIEEWEENQWREKNERQK